MRQEAVVRIANGESDPGIIGRGVRQGCPISPLLFSIYAEVMMIEAFEDSENIDVFRILRTLLLRILKME